MEFRRIFFIFIAVFLLTAGPLSLQSKATNFIDFTDTNLNTGAGVLLSDTSCWFGSWTQNVATSNTTVSAILDKNGIGTVTQGTAWLMKQVGPGTTSANQIAEAIFTTPSSTINNQDLTTAPYTTLFGGLNLPPGTYYLVL